MNRNFLFILILCFACSQPNSKESTTTSDQVPPEKETLIEEGEELEATEGLLVYVTQAGEKYHTADCRYSKSAHMVSFSKAKADGLTACGICKPNSKTGEKQLRCSATTDEGKRCQRMTTDASGKCFQHRGS